MKAIEIVWHECRNSENDRDQTRIRLLGCNPNGRCASLDASLVADDPQVEKEKEKKEKEETSPWGILAEVFDLTDDGEKEKLTGGEKNHHGQKGHAPPVFDRHSGRSVWSSTRVDSDYWHLVIDLGTESFSLHLLGTLALSLPHPTDRSPRRFLRAIVRLRWTEPSVAERTSGRSNVSSENPKGICKKRSEKREKMRSQRGWTFVRFSVTHSLPYDCEFSIFCLGSRDRSKCTIRFNFSEVLCPISTLFLWYCEANHSRWRTSFSP